MNSPNLFTKQESTARSKGASDSLWQASRAQSLREQAGLAAQLLQKGASAVGGLHMSFDGTLRERTVADVQAKAKHKHREEQVADSKSGQDASSEPGADTAGVRGDEALAGRGADAAAHAAMLLLTPVAGQPAQSGQVTVTGDAQIRRGEAQADGQERRSEASRHAESVDEDLRTKDSHQVRATRAQSVHAGESDPQQTGLHDATSAVDQPDDLDEDAQPVARVQAGGGRVRAEDARDRSAAGIGVIQQLGAVRTVLNTAERASAGTTEIWSLHALDKAGGSLRNADAKAQRPFPTHSGQDTSVVEQVQHGMIAALRHLPSPAGQRVVQMKLNPVELGPVRIQLRVAGDAVAVSFQATSAGAEESLKRSVGVLRESLERRGLRVAEMAFERAPGEVTAAIGVGLAAAHVGSGKPIAGKEARAEDAAHHLHEDGVLQTVTLRLDAHA